LFKGSSDLCKSICARLQAHGLIVDVEETQEKIITDYYPNYDCKELILYYNPEVVSTWEQIMNSISLTTQCVEGKPLMLKVLFLTNLTDKARYIAYKLTHARPKPNHTVASQASAQVEGGVQAQPSEGTVGASAQVEEGVILTRGSLDHCLLAARIMNPFLVEIRGTTICDLLKMI
jgi:hypothetical protein